jgi:hypothetical protein
LNIFFKFQIFFWKKIKNLIEYLKIYLCQNGILKIIYLFHKHVLKWSRCLRYGITNNEGYKRRAHTWNKQIAQVMCKNFVCKYFLHIEMLFHSNHHHITNLMDHDLIIIIEQNLLFVGLYGIGINIIHLFVLFEHQRCVHYLNTNVLCLFILFKHRCCMYICVIYTQNCAYNFCV